jgi:hypothetical protein
VWSELCWDQSQPEAIAAQRQAAEFHTEIHARCSRKQVEQERLDFERNSPAKHFRLWRPSVRAPGNRTELVDTPTDPRRAFSGENYLIFQSLIAHNAESPAEVFPVGAGG